MRRSEKHDLETRVVCRHDQITGFVGVSGPAACVLVKASQAAMRSGGLRMQETLAYALSGDRLIAHKNSDLRGMRRRKGIATVDEIRSWLERNMSDEAAQAQPELAVA